MPRQTITKLCGLQGTQTLTTVFGQDLSKWEERYNLAGRSVQYQSLKQGSCLYVTIPLMVLYVLYVFPLT